MTKTLAEAEIKEYPMPFSTPMVKALLDGLKTQTRWAMKPQPYEKGKRGFWYWAKCHVVYGLPNQGELYTPLLGIWQACPYGQIGGKLWVKETWATEKMFDKMSWSEIVTTKVATIPIWYKVGDTQIDRPGQTRGRWRSGFFMPRYASRITLEITEIRVQRLQEISWEDTHAEGILRFDAGNLDPANGGKGYNRGDPGLPMRYESLAAYEDLWDATNSKRGYGWSVNPFVWALTVRVV